MNFIELSAVNDHGRLFAVHLRADVITQVYAAVGQAPGKAVVMTYNSMVTVNQTPEEVMELIRNADF